ncbi:hypothetical protein VNI00_016455 [Paramarasmius palmivorus]|uniref:WD40 repeat-like protein n=1 Tax=Paramarasmius palmivorus TaxID=297713 RepID=A0AAW0BDK3_9AGAR
MTTSDRKLYTRDHLLLGHKGPAACLALHPDGTFVACGGHEGTSIWHVPASPRAIETPAPAGNRGMTTAAIWMTKRDNMDDGLAFGTEDGYLVVWRRERTTGKFEEIFCRLLQGGTYPEVTSIAFDLNSSQLAVSHRGGVVHRFLVDGAMQPRPMKSASLPFCCPQTITFGHASTNGPEIWVFNRDSGEIAIVDNEANILKMRPTGCTIGSAVMNVQDDLLALDDATPGVSVEKMQDAWAASSDTSLSHPPDQFFCQYKPLHVQDVACSYGSPELAPTSSRGGFYEVEATKYQPDFPGNLDLEEIFEAVPVRQPKDLLNLTLPEIEMWISEPIFPVIELRANKSDENSVTRHVLIAEDDSSDGEPVEDIQLDLGLAEAIVMVLLQGKVLDDPAITRQGGCFCLQEVALGLILSSEDVSP